MAKTLIKKVEGYLLVSLKGNSPERFLNLCRMKEIYIWDIRCEKNQYKFFIGVQDFKKLKLVAKKTKTRPVIEKRYGLPFFIGRWKLRYGFLAGLLLFILLIGGMSCLVWSIDVEGQYSHTKEELVKFLRKKQVTVGMLLKDVDCTILEEEIRKQFEDIGWVSARVDGTKLIVRIKETNMPKLHQAQTSPVHLVADMDGRIASIVTRNGTALVRAEDEVKAGDILISGVVEIIGDSMEVIRKNPVAADGDIMLQTTLTYRDVRPCVYRATEFTSRKNRSFSISLFGREINFSMPKLFQKNFEHSVTIAEKKAYPFVTFGFAEEKEYVPVEKEYGKDSASKYLNIRFQNYIKKMEEKGVIIEQNNVKIKKIGKTYEAFGTIEVQKPVTSYQKILDSEWRNTDSNEYSGTEHSDTSGT